ACYRCSGPVDHRHLHSFPTRRSSDLIPAIPALTELPVVADNALQQLDGVVLEAGQPGQWFKLSGAFFRSLLDGAQWVDFSIPLRSEEHTSELQSRENLVCRLLLEKKK